MTQNNHVSTENTDFDKMSPEDFKAYLQGIQRTFSDTGIAPSDLFDWGKLQQNQTHAIVESTTAEERIISVCILPFQKG